MLHFISGEYLVSNLLLECYKFGYQSVPFTDMYVMAERAKTICEDNHIGPMIMNTGNRISAAIESFPEWFYHFQENEYIEHIAIKKSISVEELTILLAGSIQPEMRAILQDVVRDTYPS